VPHLTGAAAARSISAAIIGANAAARAGDPDQFEAALVVLAAQNPEQLAVVQGAIVLSILQERHPDGLTGEDVQAAIEATVRDAGWYPGTDPEVLVATLLGALGVRDPSDQEAGFRAPGRAELSAHGALLIAGLLAPHSDRQAQSQPDGAAAGGAARPEDEESVLRRHLRVALAEIERAETMELP
jgi:hypothetical protein